MRLRVVTDVVAIVGELDGLHGLVAFAIEDVAKPVGSQTDEDAVEVGGVGDALNAGLIGNLLHQRAGFQIDDVERVVGLVGDQQPVALGVQSKMIETPGLAFKWDGLHQLQFGSSGNRNEHERQE